MTDSAAPKDPENRAAAALRVFTDLSHCSGGRSASTGLLDDPDVIAVVRANWNDLPSEERRRRFGERVGSVQPTRTMAEADVCILPKTWDYYLRARKVELAMAFARSAAECGKEVVVWNGGDLEAIVPIPNAVTFLHGPHRSLKRASAKAFAIPQFKEDWLQLYYHGKEQPRTWTPVPSVGFCGWASYWNYRTLGRAAVTSFHRAGYQLGLARYAPPSFPPPVVLRLRLLRRLTTESRLRTEFIVRGRYRGGLDASRGSDSQTKATQEFVRNIWNNDYTLCVRGVGNFSARFYETLSLGRIPIFVNTDCILPYDFKIDYSDYCMWIDEQEIHQLPQKVLEFHSRLSPTTFHDRQLRCRLLWENYLSVDGFYRHFGEHFGHHTFSPS